MSVERIAQAIDLKSSLKFQLQRDVDLENLPDPEYLVEDFIEESALTVVYGPSGGGKTFAVLDAALSVATNRPWLGKSVHAAPVVYVVGEGTLGIK